MQVEPSGSNQEENEKTEGELIASRENTTPVTSSCAPTQMEVDPAPASIASQIEEEEKKSEESTTHDGDIAPSIPQETVKKAVVTQASKEVVVPPTDENAPKEKALVPDSQKTTEGVPVKVNDGQTSASRPSAPEKLKRPLAPLKPIDEHLPASDDIRSMEMSDEENMKNPQETFPLLLA